MQTGQYVKKNDGLKLLKIYKYVESGQNITEESIRKYMNDHNIKLKDLSRSKNNNLGTELK